MNFPRSMRGSRHVSDKKQELMGETPVVSLEFISLKRSVYCKGAVKLYHYGHKIPKISLYRGNLNMYFFTAYYLTTFVMSIK